MLLKRCIYPDFCLEELGDALLIEEQETFLGYHVSVLLLPLYPELPASQSLNQKSTPSGAEPSREEQNNLL